MDSSFYFAGTPRRFDLQARGHAHQDPARQNSEVEEEK